MSLTDAEVESLRDESLKAAEQGGKIAAQVAEVCEELLELRDFVRAFDAELGRLARARKPG